MDLQHSFPQQVSSVGQLPLSQHCSSSKRHTPGLVQHSAGSGQPQTLPEPVQHLSFFGS
jgi:hypothetical protein